jgi:hypothetical protein
MFDIISRLRPITLDAYTEHAGVYYHNPVVKSTQIYPEWWKSLKSHCNVTTENSPIVTPMATIKVCEGLLDMYKNMFTIPLWTDLILKYDEHGNFGWKSSAEDTKIGHHPTGQFDHEEFNDLIHMKITVPWVLQEKSGINFQLFYSDWNKPSDMFKFRIPGGVLNYKYQCGANCNMWLPKKVNADINLYAGEPLLNLMPLTERKVILKTHLISLKEMKDMSDKFAYSSKFHGRYRLLKKKIFS